MRLTYWDVYDQYCFCTQQFRCLLISSFGFYVFYFFHSVMCVIPITLFLTTIRNTVLFCSLFSKLLLLPHNVSLGVWHFCQDCWLCSFTVPDVCLNIIQVLCFHGLFLVPVQYTLVQQSSFYCATSKHLHTPWNSRTFVTGFCAVLAVDAKLSLTWQHLHFNSFFCLFSLIEVFHFLSILSITC